MSIPDFSKMSAEAIVAAGGFDCDCGKRHETSLKYLKIGAGATRFLPEALAKLGVKRPFLVMDENTRRAAYAKVAGVLRDAGIPFAEVTLKGAHIEPDERAVGALLFAFDTTCDGVVGIGSGVVNDCCKVLAHAVGKPQAIVCTAPSMDGYASNSSSMVVGGVKSTLYNACPGAILADTDIVRQAPMRMLWAGLGDMLAKYISLTEWRVANAVIGEYYCERVAALMRASLARIVAAAPGLTARAPETIDAVIEGLILSGIAMDFAKTSRPASGVEHYFSHMWEMKALDQHLPTELHGIQVGVGTFLAFGVWRDIAALAPTREHAEAAMRAFSEEAWEAQTRRLFGGVADEIIEKEHTVYHKNDPVRQHRQMEAILAHWDDILRFAREELPPMADIVALMRGLGMPTTPADLGVSPEDARDAFIGSRDIRDKYLSSSMLWDLGLLYGFQLAVE